jgi:FkbM family methyltransferase
VNASAYLYRLAKAVHNYRRPFWLLAQRALRRETITVHDRGTGLRFRCLQGADRMLGETCHSRIYDIPAAPVRSGDVVVDVGANHGFATCWFAKRGARVYAFEPAPEVYRLLERNVAENGLADRVRTFPEAIVDREGCAELLISPVLGGGTSTLYPELAAKNALAVSSRIEVRVRSLPAVLRELEIGRVRLLKLDCEGSELAILRSLGRTTLDAIDSLAIEYHPEVYPVADLVDTVLAWGDFHLSKVATQDVANANLNAVSRRVLQEWAQTPWHETDLSLD